MDLKETIGDLLVIWGPKGQSRRERPFWSLDKDNYQTPLRAFPDRKATHTIRKSNPKWMEEDIDDGRA